MNKLNKKSPPQGGGALNPSARIKRKHLTQKQDEILTGVLFVAPALIYMVLMIGYPIIYNIILSFQDVSAYNLATGMERPFVGINNYKTVVAHETMPYAVKNTLFYTVWCLIFQFSFGLIFALLFNKTFTIAKPLRGFLVISWMMPITVTAMLWKYMLSNDAGIIDALLIHVGVIKQPIGWLLNQSTAIFGPIMANIWVGIPFNMLILTTGLSAIPDEIYEGASIDGANIIQKFWHITIPLLKPAMLSVLILGFVYTFKVFDLIFVMTNGGPVNATEVFASFSYKLSFSYYYFGQGAAVANILFVILFCVALVYLKLIRTEEAN
jgi:multiple sugar transport system permease protein